MTTFAIMRSRIADELHRTDLTTQINRAIETAIDHWGPERFFFNEKFSSFATVASTQTYSAGNASLTDVLRVNTMRVNVNSATRIPLTQWTWQQFIDRDIATAQTGIPDYYVWYADSLLLYPIPNAAYTAQLTVIMRLPEVSASATDGATNAWMTSAETLIRQRAKAVVRTDFLRDADALAEAQRLAGTRFLTALEQAAYAALLAQTDGKGTGRIVPTQF